MAAAKTDEKINGLQKAAILMIALGPEKSASIFKHLKEDEVEELTLEIANTRSITPQVKESVVNEFYQVCSSILRRAVSTTRRSCWRSLSAPRRRWT